MVTTLTMIEEPSPVPAIDNKIDYTDDEPDASILKAPLLDKEQDVPVTPRKPITSSIKSTVAHITAQGGWTMRWRGLGIGIFYCFLQLFVMAVLHGIVPKFAPFNQILVAGISAVLLSPLHCIWVHAIITKPMDMSLHQYRQEFGGQIQWKALLVPSFVAAVMAETSIQLVTHLSVMTSNYIKGSSDWRVFAASFFVLLIADVCALLFMLPSVIILTRVEASLLPESLETIVPFDRSFGGRIGVLASSKMTRARAARQGFSWLQYRRVLKVFVKVFAITMAITFLASQTVLLELFFIAGDSFRTILEAIDGQVREVMANV